MASVVIVDAELLPQCPKAFQDYVNEYFIEKNILGKRVFVATVKVCGSGYGRGTAPGHSCDLRRYKEGLAPDQSLNDWMRAVEGSILYTNYGGYDSEDVIYED